MDSSTVGNLSNMGKVANVQKDMFVLSKNKEVVSYNETYNWYNNIIGGYLKKS